MVCDGTGGWRLPFPPLVGRRSVARMAQHGPEVRALRHELRQRRQAVPAAERRAAERAIARALQRLHIFRPGTRVGVYLAMRGEVDLADAICAALRAGALLYSPKIISRRRRAMVFVPLRPRMRMTRNGFGIAEPASRPGLRQPVSTLDAVIVPLVGFDRSGNRLGMGVGFYDRALRRRQERSRSWRRPRLIGVAFACQEVEAIEPARWDVPLDLVITDRETVRCRPAPQPPARSTR